VGERRGRTFQLADAVEVELVGADLRHRGLDLKIAGMPPSRSGPPHSAGRTGPPGGRGGGRTAGGGRRRR
jgi:hypothetical protein